jgi:hypothetical protein
LQPAVDKLDGAADLGLHEWHTEEPLDFLRDFRLRQVPLMPEPVSILLLWRWAIEMRRIFRPVSREPSSMTPTIGLDLRRSGNGAAALSGPRPPDAQFAHLPHINIRGFAEIVNAPTSILGRF